MRIIVEMTGSVWPSIHLVTQNIPADERITECKKEYDLKRCQWYVDYVVGQECLFV